MANPYLQAARTYVRKSTLLLLSLWALMVILFWIGQPAPMPDLVLALLAFLVLMSSAFLGGHLNEQFSHWRSHLLPGFALPHLGQPRPFREPQTVKQSRVSWSPPVGLRLLRAKNP